MIIDRCAILCTAIHNTIQDVEHGKLKSDLATLQIAEFIDRFNAGERIGIDARAYFPFWFRAREMNREKR